MDDYFIKEGKIGLRAIEPMDEGSFFRWHNDLILREKIGGMFPFNRNTFNEICHSRMERHPSDIWFAICNEDMLVGIIGLHNLKYIQRNAEIAILIGESAHRNKKIGRYVLKLIEEYAFGTLGLHRLYALVYSDNLPALHFFERCKWEQEGTLKEASYWNYHFRDIVIWAKIRCELKNNCAVLIPHRL